MDICLGSNFESYFCGKSRERITVEEQFYHPKFREATWFFEENLKESPTAGYLISQADHCYYQKKWLDAAQHYLKARELLTEKSSLLQRITLESLSRCYLHLGQYNTSMEYAHKLLDVCHSLELSVVAHSLISNICHELNHSAEEAEHLKYCLSRQPLNGIHWFHLGLSYLARREKCYPPATQGGDDSCHHLKPNKQETDQPTTQDSGGVSEELVFLLSQSDIVAHCQHGTTNGFESAVSEDGSKLGVHFETKQNQYNKEMILKEENSIGESCASDNRRKLNMKDLSNGKEMEQHGVDMKHLQTNMGETLDVLSNGSSEEGGRMVRCLRGSREEGSMERCLRVNREEERVESHLRVSREGGGKLERRLGGTSNHDSAESRECLHDATSQKGKGNDGSCHDGVCTTHIEDHIFALICFIRARMLLKPTSTLCNSKSKKVLMEVEGYLQSLKFTEAYIAEVHQLCWKRQFSLETKQSKTEDNEKKGRNHKDIVGDHLTSIFEDIWFRGILLQINVNSGPENDEGNIPEETL